MLKNINKLIKSKNDSKLIITKEQLSERCEVCHKTDLYDPYNNYCKRCENISMEINTKEDINSKPINNPTDLFICISLIVGLISNIIHTVIISVIDKYSSGLVSAIFFFSIALTIQGYLMGQFAKEYNNKSKRFIKVLIISIGIIYSVGFVIFILLINHMVKPQNLIYPFCLCLINALILFLIYDLPTINKWVNKLNKYKF